MLKTLRKKWWLSLVILGMMLILPFSVSAITMPEVLQVLDKVIEGILRAGRDAYCAAGVGPLCP